MHFRLTRVRLIVKYNGKRLILLLVALVVGAIGAIVFQSRADAANSAPKSGVVMPEANPFLTPPSRDGEKIPVEIALQVVNLSGIDEVGECFRVVAYLLASWKDPRLAFTPAAASESFRVYDPAEIWIPHFDFANGVVPHSSFDVTLRVFPDGTVKYYERSSAELSSSFHLRNFPFDQQELDIFIHPPISEGRLVNFVGTATDASISVEQRVYSSLAQWDIVGIRASAELIRLFNQDSTNQMRFAIEVKRKSNFYIWKVFLPLLLMVAVSWTVFWIDGTEFNSQVTIAVTTILTVIAFSFAISNNLPKVAYLTFIDVFFLCCYAFVFITAIEITLVHRASRIDRDRLGETIRHFSRIVLPLLFVITNLLMVAIYFG
jgi:Neurotransmitter-gated ion-channel ligand binding domain/Neurotransmitter-gated ion-channel transmembrane region